MNENRSINTEKHETDPCKFWSVLREMIVGLGLMVFAIFLFFNVLLFVQGESIVIGLFVTWLVMLLGITNLLFAIIDVNKNIDKKKKKQ